MIHVFTMNEINIAVDGNSGSINILDNAAYELLKHFSSPFSVEQANEFLKGKYSEECIVETYGEIQTLIDNGSLFSKELDSNWITENMHKDIGIKALCLHVAHDCNLMCEYCFASKGTYKVAKNLMPAEVACKGVDFLLSNSGKRKNVEIDFFGGEPLLNFDVVKQTVEYGKKVQGKYGITSCGAGTEYFAVTPEGDLYPCHQFVGESEFKIGSLDSGIQNQTLESKLKKASIFTKDECRNCWAKLYCSGGCHANSYYSNGDILKPDKTVCEMQRKRIECAIMIEVSKLVDTKEA